MMSKPTLAAKLALAGGRPSGFDYLRITLALSVMVMHVTVTTYGREAERALWSTAAQPFLLAIVPAFFVLSGFLVTGSLERCRTIYMFVGLRAIRIYPALTVEILLSAFSIGPLVTTVAWDRYFTDALFFRYLVNVTGHISYLLPGVFSDNPLPNTVNAQLWTVPWELYCYLSLVALTLIGIRKYRFLVILGIILASVGDFSAKLMSPNGYELTKIQATPLIAYFLAGVAFYLYREQVRFSLLFALLSAADVIFALWILPGGEYLAIPALAYFTIYVGLLDPKRIRLIRAADYSYGIYLYGFVIQQTIMHKFPTLREWYWNLFICIPLSVFCAAGSWHFVELPAMKLRGLLKRSEERWIEFQGIARMKLGFRSL